MKNLLVLIFVVLLCVVGFGFYRGWFSTTTSTQDHKTNVNLTVDRDKIQDDVNSLKKQTSIATGSQSPVVPPK